MASERIEILIEIKGGCVTVVSAKDAVPVDVSVLDWDNVECGGEFRNMRDKVQIEQWVESNFPLQLY